MQEELAHGLQKLGARDHQWREERDYYRGTHERPFAPQGVSLEYRALQEMSVAPWLRLVVKAPLQRLRVIGFRQAADTDPDHRAWETWRASGMDARQRAVYQDALVHGRGVVSVGAAADGGAPEIRPESPRQVYVHYEGGDFLNPEWAVKVWRRGVGTQAQQFVTLFTPGQARVFNLSGDGVTVGEQEGDTITLTHGEIPLTEFVADRDSLGHVSSLIRPLFPMQRAIDTMRFDLLLAAQFSAYRQRVVTGFDPVIRGEDGQPIFREDSEGNLVLDQDGNPIPLTATPGRPGVDRLLAFPGADTRVFDLAESNLANYASTIKMLVQQLAAIAQIPPQYLLGDMANLSGEALEAAESTLGAAVSEMKLSFSPSWERVARLTNLVRGEGDAVEALWSEESAKSFGVIVDGISKLVAAGFPKAAAWEMLPGATQPQVRRWKTLAEEELSGGNPYARALAEGLAEDLEP